jgi:hypothetical protein
MGGTNASGDLGDLVRPDAPRADADALVATIDDRTDPLEVRLEAPGADVMRVAEGSSDDGLLTAHFTLLGHVEIFLQEKALKYIRARVRTGLASAVV